MAEHSVIIDETFNVEQDLLFLNDLSNNLTQFFNEIDIFLQKGFEDASSNADAIIDVPLENFRELFKLRFKTTIIKTNEVQFFIDSTKWNHNGIVDAPIVFSNSIVQKGDLLRGAIDPSHNNQTLKRDISRHIFSYIPNIGRLNNLLSFQNKIVGMIEEMDHVFHENILNELNKLTLKGYQNYAVMNDNPLRILFSSIYLEDDNIGHEDDNIESNMEIRTNLFKEEALRVIERHVKEISQYCYYVEEIINNQTFFCGPIFISKETLLACAFSLQRFVNFQLETIDGFDIQQLSLSEFPDYLFYYIPGIKYDQGSYQKYEHLSDLLLNIELIQKIDIWNGAFSDHINIDMDLPFIENDKISLLLTYKSDHLNFKIFNETFGNYGETEIITPRTYQIFLNMKKTRIDENPIIIFGEIFLSLLKSSKHSVTYLVDVVKIRIELEILIYHRGMIEINDQEKKIVEELKNTSILEYIFESIKLWQYWYNNWYLIGNPIQEQQNIKNSIISYKNTIIELGFTINTLDFLLNNIN